MHRLSHPLLLLLLFLLGAAHAFLGADAVIEDEFGLPPGLGKQAPSRLVFNQKDLAACFADPTASRCVLRGPVKIDEQAWRAQFPATHGTAVITAARQNLTLTSGPCPDCPGLNSTLEDSGNVVQIPHLERLDWNAVAGVLALQPGTRLRLSNLHLENFAFKSTYQYSSDAPYQSVGLGVSIFPTINVAPNTTLLGLNITGTYLNPSTTDDCPRYVEKTLSYLILSFGAANITAVNPTSTLIIGPIKTTTPVRNGSTGAPAGNATSIYKYLTVACVEKDGAVTAGDQLRSNLAAAIAAPVAAALLLAGGLLLLWWLRRRKHKSRPSGGATGGSKALAEAMLLDAAEQGASTATPEGSHHSQAGVKASLQQAPAVAGAPWSPQTPSPVQTMPTINPAVPAAAPPQHAVSTASAGVSPAALKTLAAPSSGVSGVAAACAPSDGLSSSYETPPLPAQATSSGTWDASTAGSSRGTPLFGTKRSGLGKVSRTGDDSPDTTPAVLKARSDAAVLKEVKLGPLLGQGCFGQVYRGRWKATPVAVKIIEHYTSAEGVGSSRGNRISAGREMLFATSMSHPNLVTNYHISTLSSSQRTAVAKPPTSSSQDDSSRCRSSSSSGGGSSSAGDTDEPQPDLLETWIVMEYCPKGSLEKALKTGKLRRADGTPDMGTVYKALLDTASGLDYLHSIGCVHGDLKLANVLLKAGSKEQRGICCKITDFGLSRVLDMNASHISTATHGTITYMPKELLLSGRMTQATDIYSFGLMMWELFSGQLVTDAEEETSVGQLFCMIAYQDWRPEVPPDCPPGYADLMAACWHDDPEQRPSAQQLLRRLQVLQGQARQDVTPARRTPAAAATTPAPAPGSAQPVRLGHGAAGQSNPRSCGPSHLPVNSSSTTSSRKASRGPAQDSSWTPLASTGSPAAADTHSTDRPGLQLRTSSSKAGRQGAAAGSPAAGQQPEQGVWAGLSGVGSSPSALTAEQVSAMQFVPALIEQQQQMLSSGCLHELSIHYQQQDQQYWAAHLSAQSAASWSGQHAQEELLHSYQQAALHAGVSTTDLALVDASYVGVVPPAMLAGSGVSAQVLMQVQWQQAATAAASMRPPDLGYVNLYGQEFQGCLPERTASGEDWELSPPVQQYIAALQAASAQKAAAAGGH